MECLAVTDHPASVCFLLVCVAPPYLTISGGVVLFHEPPPHQQRFIAGSTTTIVLVCSARPPRAAPSPLPSHPLFPADGRAIRSPLGGCSTAVNSRAAITVDTIPTALTAWHVPSAVALHGGKVADVATHQLFRSHSSAVAVAAGVVIVAVAATVATTQPAAPPRPRPPRPPTLTTLRDRRRGRYRPPRPCRSRCPGAVTPRPPLPRRRPDAAPLRRPPPPHPL